MNATTSKEICLAMVAFVATFLSSFTINGCHGIPHLVSTLVLHPLKHSKQARSQRHPMLVAEVQQSQQSRSVWRHSALLIREILIGLQKALLMSICHVQML